MNVVEFWKIANDTKAKFKLPNKIGRMSGIVMMHYVADKNSKRCDGTGQVKFPWWRRVWAHYIERLEWQFIKTHRPCDCCTLEEMKT